MGGIPTTLERGSLGFLALSVVASCAPTGDPGRVAGDGVAITVAPLDLPGVSDASWRISVSGTAGQVWTRDLTSSSYGDGAGSLSYVGPCDAAANPNTITLELLQLDGPGGQPLAASDYRNPGALSRDFDCLEDADVAVAFDVTVARRALQGFFDIAIAFEDIFCSAKLDCLTEEGAPLELLHPPGGGRGQTVVAALTCVAGEGESTRLLMDGWSFDCSDGTHVAHDPSEGPGNVGAGASPYLFQRAVFRGPTSFGTVSGCYWNQALGLDLDAIPTAVSCTLSGRATATSDAFSGTATPDGWVWPVISWSVPVVTGGALACGHHPVDVSGSGVATGYTGPASDDFAYAWGCVGPVTASATICAGPLGPTDCSDDGDPCTAETCLADGTCDRTYTCATMNAGTIAYSVVPASDADGLLHTAGRQVPVNGSAPQGDLHRVGRSYALRSSDLGVAWGPLPSAGSCGQNAGPHQPAIDDALGYMYSQGDWNDGSNNYCASIFAKDTATGAAVWDQQPGGPHPRHPIALSDTRAYYGGWQGSIKSFDLASGAVGATMNLSAGSSDGGGLVLTSNDDMIASQNNYKIERWTVSGTRLWTSTAIRNREIHMTLGDDVVGWSSANDALVYVDGDDGQLVWSHPVTGGGAAILTDAAGALYYGEGAGAASLDATGAVRWATPLNGAGKAQLLGDDGRVYVGTWASLYALDAATGDVVWRFDAVDEQVSIDNVVQDNGFSGTWALLAGGDLFNSDWAGRTYRLATAGLDYADAPWARPRGNRRNSGKIWDYAPLPAAP